MKIGNYESYHLFTIDDLVQLNTLLAKVYTTHPWIKSCNKKNEYGFINKIRFNSLDTSNKHILTRKIGDPRPCGTITIYKDIKHSLPIELCLNITLDTIRKNMKICEIGRLAILPEHRKNNDNLLLLFIETIEHCLNNQIHLLTIQALPFNHESYNSLGFNYFNGFTKGCYDLEFDTICYPMYAYVHKIYNNFKQNILNDKTISIMKYQDALLLKEDIQNINVRINYEESNVEYKSN